MSLDETLFVGRPYSREPSFSLETVLRRHTAVREAVALAVHREIEAERKLWPIVAMLSLVYSFNVYKAIGLVLGERHYEAAAPMLRQLWETSLNLHWIELDPDARAQDFCNFTALEYRKQLARRASGDLDPENVLGAPSLQEFDRVARRFQEKFFTDRGGRRRPHGNFSAKDVQSRARQVGDPWKGEYSLVYDLASSHAHGAPGAVLRPLFMADPQRREASEIDASALLALKSINLIVRDVHVLSRADLLPSTPDVDAAAEDKELPEPGQEPEKNQVGAEP